MTKKKRFGISTELNQGFNDTLSAVENHAGNFSYQVVALHRIEKDPDNPRELYIEETDIIEGIKANDPNKDKKEKELEELNLLSKTIEKDGILQPIILYKHSEKYRIIAGERRFLATLVSKKSDIQAKIISKKPDELSLRIMQWVENNSRENLTLREKIINVKQILDEYLKTASTTINAAKLAELIGVSERHARRYLDIMSSPKNVLDCIEDGSITDVNVAELIASIKDPEIVENLIARAKEGVGYQEMKKQYSALKATSTNSAKRNGLSVKNKEGRGRMAKRVNMGFTHNPKVIDVIANAILSSSKFSVIKNGFKDVNWLSLSEANKAFSKLIKAMEGILDE